MPDLNERDAKVVQYLMEAHAKEMELESALQTHIEMTTKMPYKKRLRKHLTETRQHGRLLDKRIKQLGGGGHKLDTIVAKGVAAVKAPMHIARGASDEEKMLKNAKTEYFNEAEEIATYTALEEFAEKVGDKETAKVARTIRRDEERMASFLEGQIKTLAKAVAVEEIPSQQRTPAGRRAQGQRRGGAASRNGAGRGAARSGTTRSRRTGTTTSGRRKTAAASR